MLPANNSSRKNTRNLLADNRYLVSFNRERVLFIDKARLLVRGHQKLAFGVGDIRYFPGNRGAIDVNIQGR
jgi:hypothetical protein